MKFKSLAGRLFVFVFGLVAVVVLTVLMVVRNANMRIAQEAVRRHLESGRTLFSEVVQHREDQLQLTARVLSSDFAFREAIGTRDTPTVLSALANHSSRIDATMALLLDPQGRILADTLRPERTGGSAEAVYGLTAWQAAEPSSLRVLGGRAYQVITVPVRAPLPIATLLMGFEIDDRLASDLRDMTGLDVAFVHETDEGLRSIASTEGAADWKRRAGITTLENTADAGYDSGAIVERFDSRESARIAAVLLAPKDDLLRPFERIAALVAVLAVFGVAAAAVGSVAVARGVTRPLRSMAELAAAYARGEFDAAPTVDRDDEIGTLGRAFRSMRDGLEAREREILRLAYRDPLTNLPNRTLFTDRLERAVAASRRSGTPVTVLMLDIDRFKDANSVLGHRAGDRILIEVAERIGTVTRDSDTLARLGGDEFAMLIVDGGADREVREVADKIRRVLHDPVRVDDESIDVVASVGAASFPRHGEDPEDIIRRADTAMYAAKAASSGYQLYDPDVDEDRRSRLSLLSDLRHGIEQRHLEVWYQPKIDLRSVRTCGVEALLRWRHPERGIVAPGEFIEYAERTGFVREITRYVIDLVTEQVSRWQARGIGLTVSFNVSARDLSEGEIVDRIESSLQRYGLRADTLCVEVTETAIMDSPKAALATLDRMRAMGLKLSIDDFGAGHSSLGYLSRLPVHELKVDRSFVLEMSKSESARAIVRSAIDLGHHMGMSVTGEGVEDEETWNALVELGCDAAQGFWMSRAIPDRDLRSWLKKSRFGLARRVLS